MFDMLACSRGFVSNGAAVAWFRRGARAGQYRLLRAILTTAVKEEEILRASPCRIPGADQEKSAERSA
jgi:hypothetical protein